MTVRLACASCGRRYAVNKNGSVRSHPCVPADMPISGRSEPREDAGPFNHNLRLYGQPGGEVRAVCICTEGTGTDERVWARTFEPGHAPNDFVRLEMMHVTGRYA